MEFYDNEDEVAVEIKIRKLLYKVCDYFQSKTILRIYDEETNHLLDSYTADIETITQVIRKKVVIK